MLVPGSVNPLLLALAGDPLDEFFKVERSVRFNSADAPSLTWTPGVAGNSKTFTINFSFKRSELDNNQVLFHANGSTSAFKIYFNGADNQLWVDANNGTLTFAARTGRLFRDVLSHEVDITIAIDTTQATKEAGVRIEVGGVVDTLFTSANWTQNADLWWNRSGVVHSIGRGQYTTGTAYSAGGYLSNVRVVDGQFLTGASFNKVHPRTDQRRPIRYAGAYGTNGFWLDFSDGSAATSAALGKDRSGNNNDWTPTNISVAAGAGCDSLLDTPTNNFCVLNWLKNNATLTNGALTISGSGQSHGTFRIPKNFPVYFEANTAGSVSVALGFGLGVARADILVTTSHTGGGVGVVGFYASAGANLLSEAGGVLPISGLPVANDVMQVAINWPKMWIGRNDVWLDSAGGTTGNPATGANATFTLSDSYEYVPYVEVGGNTSNANFGQRAWDRTCPTGFVGYGTKNLPVNYTVMKGENAFVARADTGANIVATLAAAAPWADWIKIYKRRNSAEGWRWQFSDDAANYMDSSSTAAKAAFPALSGTSYIGYALKVSAANGIATGRLTHVNGVADVVADGLAKLRKMIILKNEATGTWYVYHPDLTAGKLLYLNTTGAETTDATISTVTTSGFTVAAALASGTYRWIVIAEIEGFSRVGKYQGNASADGAFANCGFSPSLFWQRRPAGGTWNVLDTTRNPTNVVGELMYMEKADAGATYTLLDIDSNGVKLRIAGSNFNENEPEIFVSFAAFPFRYANAR